jgi:hypothetical protein
MFRNLRSVIVFGLSFGPLIAASAAADARSFGAYAGLAAPPTAANLACFKETYGGVENANCTGQVAWEVAAMPVDASGYYHPQLQVSAGYGGTTGSFCSACGMSGDGLTKYCVPNQNLSQGQVATLTFSNVYVPAGGYMFTACNLNGGGVWQSVNY